MSTASVFYPVVLYSRYIYQRRETYITGAKSRTDFYGNIADSWGEFYTVCGINFTIFIHQFSPEVPNRMKLVVVI
jgi:hypothetical protein